MNGNTENVSYKDMISHTDGIRKIFHRDQMAIWDEIKLLRQDNMRRDRQMIALLTGILVAMVFNVILSASAFPGLFGG